MSTDIMQNLTFITLTLVSGKSTTLKILTHMELGQPAGLTLIITHSHFSGESKRHSWADNTRLKRQFGEGARKRKENCIPTYPNFFGPVTQKQRSPPPPTWCHFKIQACWVVQVSRQSHALYIPFNSIIPQGEPKVILKHTLDHKL